MTMPAKARRASKTEVPPAAVPPSAAPKTAQGAELRFHPFAALEEGATAEYPGLLFERQVRDAYEVLKIALARVDEGDDRFQSIADLSLGVMNAIATVFQVPGAEAIRGNPIAEEHDRRSALACFLAGFEVAKLAIATADTPALSSIDEFEKDARSRSARKAARAKARTAKARADALRAVWATGRFSNKELCADQEWSALGFGSRVTARKALLNAPDPLNWSAKPQRR